jgi:hypothetical protein
LLLPSNVSIRSDPALKIPPLPSSPAAKILAALQEYSRPFTGGRRTKESLTIAFVARSSRASGSKQAGLPECGLYMWNKFPDLCRAIREKVRLDRDARAGEIIRAVTDAIAKDPPPSVESVAKRLGFTNSWALWKHARNRCNELVPRQKTYENARDLTEKKAHHARPGRIYPSFIQSPGHVPHLVAYCCFAVLCSLAHVFAIAAWDRGAEVFAPAVIQCAKYSASKL